MILPACLQQLLLRFPSPPPLLCGLHLPCLHLAAACLCAVGRSASNQLEAEAVVAAVERLVAAGVALGQCSVICFFRAQVALVRSLLDRRLPQLEQRQRQQRRQQRRSPRAATEALPQAFGGASSSRVAEGRDSLGGEEPGPGRRGGSEDAEGSGGDDEPEQQQQGIQIATVDSFQARAAACISRHPGSPASPCHACRLAGSTQRSTPALPPLSALPACCAAGGRV